MPKSYTATKMSGVKIEIALPAYDNDAKKHHAARVALIGFALNGGFKVRIESDVSYLGAAKDVPWTNYEIWTAINNYSALNTFLADKIKELYIEGINENPSS